MLINNFNSACHAGCMLSWNMFRKKIVIIIVVVRYRHSRHSRHHHHHHRHRLRRWIRRSRRRLHRHRHHLHQDYVAFQISLPSGLTVNVLDAYGGLMNVNVQGSNNEIWEGICSNKTSASSDKELVRSDDLIRYDDSNTHPNTPPMDNVGQVL